MENRNKAENIKKKTSEYENRNTGNKNIWKTATLEHLKTEMIMTNRIIWKEKNLIDNKLKTLEQSSPISFLSCL